MIGAALAQSAPAAQPQQPPSAGFPNGADSAVSNSTENIVVTGSRLKTTNATSESPVTIVTSAQIEHSSAQTIEEVLQQLPSVGTSGLYGGTNNGGEGASCTDIRNLGLTRVLVLVNGRRFVHSGIFGVDCVDLNNIPLSLIESIEVLKDGASTVYGADAVAGVINIKLKNNFNGTTFKADGSIGTDNGNGRDGTFSATTGHAFDKGNIVASVDYENRSPVQQRDYSFANPVFQTNVAGAVNTTGSSTPLGTRVTADGNNTSPDAPVGTRYVGTPGGPVTKFTTADRFNLGQEPYLAGALERESFTSLGHYDFTDNIEGYLETYFTHKRTFTQLSPQPVTGGLNTNVVPDAFVVPAGNPYLTALFGANSGPVDIRHRVGEFGDRDNIASTNTFQFNGGFKGQIGWGWDYDTFFTYGESDNTIQSTGEVNFARLEQEVGFQASTDPAALANAALNGDPTTLGIYNPNVCQAAQGCVLINPFGKGAISQAGVNYARFTETATSQFSLRTFGGSVSNSNVVDLPFGPLGVALGVEHRREAGAYNPDNLVGTGVTLENSQSPTNGAFDVTELYGETKIPLLKDLPGAKDLHIDLGGRFFAYNTFGTGEVWKISGNYTPITGIRFRASIGTSFRQPSINELFGGQALSFNGAFDPCDSNQIRSYSGAAQANVRANCLRQGVNPATFQAINSQVQTITGGNPLLNPETSRVETLGVVLNPPFIPRSALTVDYFRYKIANSIGAVDTQTILDDCYTSPGLSNPFCRGITPRAAQQQLNTVSAINQNLGVTREDGLEVGLTYSYPTTSYGVFSFQNDAAFVFEYLSQNVPNGPFINYAGSIGSPSLYGTGYPRLRDNLSLGWSLGDFSFGYRMRYISSLKFYPYLAAPLSQYAHSATDEVFYHDITASYTYGNLAATIGVDNLFDKTPPFVFDTSTNTDPQVYDILGRVVYVKTTFRF